MLETAVMAVLILAVGHVLVARAARSAPAGSPPPELASVLPSKAPAALPADMGAFLGLPSLSRPHTREVSLVAVRVVDYDGLVARLDLAALFTFENAFYGQVTKVAETWQGEIDRFDGASVLLAFGRILDLEDHRAAARDAAVALLRSLPDRLGGVVATGAAPQVAVALTAGEVVTGPVGVDYRKVFTVFGPPVSEVGHLLVRAGAGRLLVAEGRGFSGLDVVGDLRPGNGAVEVTPRAEPDGR